MELSFNQNMGISPTLPNLTFREKSNVFVELTEFDNQAINYVKDLVINKISLESLSSSLKMSIDWRLSIVEHMRDKVKEELSKKGLVEIIKLLASDNPNSIMVDLQHSGIHDEAALLDIAKVCIEKRPLRSMLYIKEFNISSQAGLAELYKHCIENCIKDNPYSLIQNLPDFGITDRKELVAILNRIADFRPDLILNNIKKFGLKELDDIHSVILKCTNQPPNSTSKLVKLWMKDNIELLLSIKNFDREKTPTVIKIQCSSQIQKIFTSFKSFAESPEAELIGRNFWHICYKYNKNTMNLNDWMSPTKMKQEVLMSRCEQTNQALMIAIFGVNDPQLQETDLISDSINQDNLNKLWSVVKDNEKQFDGKSLSHFVAYSFSCNKMDHVFMVIQHKDEKGEIKYRVLQSWVKHHSLNDYMTKRCMDLTSEKFIKFTAKFNHVLMHKTWTNEKNIFYNQYFMKNEDNRKIGESHFEDRLNIQWGSSNLDRFQLEKAKFEIFKESYCQIY